MVEFDLAMIIIAGYFNFSHVMIVAVVIVVTVIVQVEIGILQNEILRVEIVTRQNEDATLMKNVAVDVRPQLKVIYLFIFSTKKYCRINALE